MVVSGALGILKPEPAIYRACLERSRLAPESAIYVDDSARNVASAAALGIEAIRFTGADALRAGLTARGLL